MVLIPRICEYCSSPFMAHDYGLKRGRGRYCSLKCRSHGRPKVSVLERFWAKVEQPVDPAGCWRWKGGSDKGGYGGLTISKKRYPVHRLIYELTVGPIPDGLTIDHLCRNPWW